MVLNLVADQVVKGRIYPALATHQARPYTQAWREFGSHYPYTVPIRFQEYCEAHGVPLNIYTIDNFPLHSYYPIGLAFFNFGIDYFALLPATVFDAVASGALKILFYYHEGDNPHNIKQRLDQLAHAHDLKSNCYVFVSGNTAAKNIPGFVYFCDFELWYWSRNKNIPAVAIHTDPRSHDFTALVRLHKTWRAIGMANLHHQGLLDRSQWSYCESGTVEDDSPIEIDTLDLRLITQQFLTTVPHYCDDFSQDERNNHSLIYSKHFSDSYCNIVFETHFDADASGGAFITEKTFKPIKHGQLFYIAGTQGSLQLLKELGYKTFWRVFDTSYDNVENHTSRWREFADSLFFARRRIDERFAVSLNDIKYNQQLFLANKAERLNNLFESIHEQS